MADDRCAECGKPFEADETQVRIARRDEAGNAKRGEFDVYHVRCWLPDESK